MKKLEKMLIIQQQYEKEELEVSDMTDTMYNELEKVYQMQIYQLNNEIKEHNKNINECKKNILLLKN